MIIDYLHDDTRALGRCGLVSRFWLPSSRFHLFSTIRLYDHNTDAAFAALSPPNSTIPPSVRCVQILGGKGMGEQIHQLLQHLRPFNAVERLSLGHFCCQENQTFCIDTLFPYLKILELHGLQLETIGTALKLISSASSLECLRLGNMFGNSGPIWGFGLEKWDVALLNRFPVPPLKQITFEKPFHVPALVDWLSFGQPFASVNTVTLTLKYHQVITLVSGYLKVLGPVLEHLVLIFDFREGVLGMPIQV
jgi:hypothetical protein